MLALYSFISVMGYTIFWASGFLGVYSFFMQAYKNWQLKTTTGMGIYKIWILYTSSAILGGYVYLGQTAFPRKIFFPLEFGIVCSYVIQDFLYADSQAKTQCLCLMYGLSTFFHLFLVYKTIMLTDQFYPTLGWTAMCIMAVTSVPQIIAIYRKKTAYGVSTISVVSNIVRLCINTWVSWALFDEGWPFIFNCLRSLCIMLTLLFQIIYFGQKKPVGEKATIW